MASVADAATPTPSPAAPLRLVCSEVWGGNRPIDTPIVLPGISGKVYSRPCEGGRGGDIHYLSVCDSGLVCQMLLADVVGHGEAVADVSDAIHALLRRYLNRLDQRRVLARLNKRLAKIGLESLTTAVAVNYFPPWRRLSVSYAGHPTALLYRGASGLWTPITTRPARRHAERLADLPLAVDPRTVFTRRTLRVAYGDRLLVLTDGVLEAPDKTGELLGGECFQELLQQSGHGEPAEVVDRIVEALITRAGQAGLTHDDVTLLLVEFVPGPRGPTLWHAIKNRLWRPRGVRLEQVTKATADVSRGDGPA